MTDGGWPTRAPEQDHLPVPLGRWWRVLVVVVGAAIAAGALAVVVATSDDDDGDFRQVPATVEPRLDDPSISSISVEVSRAVPANGRVKVGGDDVDRVDIDGPALCGARSGGGNTWIDVTFCAAGGSLTITVHDGDDATSTFIVEF